MFNGCYGWLMDGMDLTIVTTINFPAKTRATLQILSMAYTTWYTTLDFIRCSVDIVHATGQTKEFY